MNFTTSSTANSASTASSCSKSARMSSSMPMVTKKSPSNTSRKGLM
jgi:hypothetical protein